MVKPFKDMTGAEIDQMANQLSEAIRDILPPDALFFATFGSKILGNVPVHQVGQHLRKFADDMDREFLAPRN